MVTKKHKAAATTKRTKKTTAKANGSKANEIVLIDDGESPVGKPVPEGYGYPYGLGDISLLLAKAAMNGPAGETLADKSPKPPKRNHGGRKTKWHNLLKVNDELRTKNPDVTDKEILKTYHRRYTVNMGNPRADEKQLQDARRSRNRSNRGKGKATTVNSTGN